jgi:hypothetical protein
MLAPYEGISVSGGGPLSRWERIAIVTDAGWIRHAVNVFRFLMPGVLGVFPVSAASDAGRLSL